MSILVLYFGLFNCYIFIWNVGRHYYEQNGYTAFIKASQQGHTASVQLLVGAGAKTEAKSNAVRENGCFTDAICKEEQVEGCGEDGPFGD